MVLANLLEVCVQTMRKYRQKLETLDPKKWEENEDDREILYSYLKKKGKHQRAERTEDNK